MRLNILKSRNCRWLKILTNLEKIAYRFNHRLGKFIIAEYVNSQGSRFIEWIPNEVTVDTENCDHDEWSMVNATSNRPKILAEQTFKLNIKAIGYFQVSLKRNRLTFFSRENSLLADLLFQYGDAEKTITTFRTIIPTTRRDRFTYDIIDVSDGNAELLSLRKSFYELNLFPESEDRFDRQFFRDLRDNPYEATMSAFSKITNFGKFFFGGGGEKSFKNLHFFRVKKLQIDAVFYLLIFS